MATENEKKDWERALDVLTEFSVTDVSIRKMYAELVSEHVTKIESMFVRLSNALKGPQKKAATGKRQREARVAVQATVEPRVAFAVEPFDRSFFEDVADVATKCPARIILSAPEGIAWGDNPQFLTLIRCTIADVEFPHDDDGFEPRALEANEVAFEGLMFLTMNAFLDGSMLFLFRYERLARFQMPVEGETLAPPAPETAPSLPAVDTLPSPPPVPEGLTKQLLAAVADGRIKMTITPGVRGGLAAKFEDVADGESVTVPG